MKSQPLLSKRTILLVSAVYLGNLVATRSVAVSAGIVMVLAGLPFYYHWRRVSIRQSQSL